MAKKKYTTEFNTRQIMHSVNYEVFNYHDVAPSRVLEHHHNHYEFYFFLEGNVSYEINGVNYELLPGDFMLIPMGQRHQPHIMSSEISYRRMVLWMSREYYEALCAKERDFAYGYDYVKQQKQYHFRPDFFAARQLQGKLLELLEEISSSRPFHKQLSDIKLEEFLVFVNRIIFELRNSQVKAYDNALYLNVCDYINSHLQEELKLEALANFFYVSKYHIAHIFKENMGLSIHQYILKKRLQAAKTGILSSVPIQQVGTELGFADYTSFFRAFKKEYGLSPKEYKLQNKPTEVTSRDTI